MAFAGFNITEGQANGVVPQPSMLTGGPLIHGTDRPDQIHTLFYGTDRTMNVEFKLMRQVRCYIGMEVFVMAVLDLG